MSKRLRSGESIWRDSKSGGYVAEVRGLYNVGRGVHEWIRLGTYGTREAATDAIIKARA